MDIKDKKSDSYNSSLDKSIAPQPVSVILTIPPNSSRRAAEYLFY
jgi:hypothetical protein